MNVLARIDDVWNPILVKEVRQALRQRYFKVGFATALFVAAVVFAVWAAQVPAHAVDVDGGVVFALLQASLALACYGLVPLGAWLSMDEEWRDGNLDLLRLSRMSSFRILTGKLLAALVQVLLFVSAFTPFLVFATLLRGVDPGLARGAVIEIVARSSMLVCLALLLACLARSDSLRTSLVTALGFVCAGAVLLQVWYVVRVSDSNLQGMSPYPSLGNQLAAGLLDVSCAALLMAAALARIEHSAVNTSSRTRIVTTACVAAMLLRLWVYEPPVLGGDTWFAVHWLVTVLMVLVPSAFFITEPDRGAARSHRQDWKHAMKLTITAGLLIAGASFPALEVLTVPDQEVDALLTTDELEELQQQYRKLLAEIEYQDNLAEIEHLERSLARRREMRAEEREMAELQRALEIEHEELEVRVERELERAERHMERASETAERALEEVEEELEMRMQQEEQRFEIEMQEALREVEDEDDRERLAGRLELEWIERERKLRRELRDVTRAHEQEAMQVAADLEDEHHTIEEKGRARMREIERRIAEHEYAFEEKVEDGEARAEIEDVRRELEAERRRMEMEFELEALERHIEELECAREEREYEDDVWDSEEDWDDDDEGDEEDDCDEDDDDDEHEGADMGDVLEALEHLQEQIDDLREEVDAIWKRLREHEKGEKGDEVAVGGDR